MKCKELLELWITSCLFQDLTNRCPSFLIMSVIGVLPKTRDK